MAIYRRYTAANALPYHMRVFIYLNEVHRSILFSSKAAIRVRMMFTLHPVLVKADLLNPFLPLARPR